TSALQLGGVDINTAGTLTNVAYENQANTFTAVQTISSGGLDVTGGIDNNAGGIIAAGSITGATNITANGTLTLSGASPIAFINAAHELTLGASDTKATLTIQDSAGSPNTLLTLVDNGTSGTLNVATINATPALQLGGVDMN